MLTKTKESRVGGKFMKAVTEREAQQVVLEYVKKRKNTDRINILTIREEDGLWIVSGTCPIDLQGHPWTERFEIIVDKKGKIKTTDFSLL